MRSGKNPASFLQNSGKYVENSLDFSTLMW